MYMQTESYTLSFNYLNACHNFPVIFELDSIYNPLMKSGPGQLLRSPEKCVSQLVWMNLEIPCK